jgi:amino acid adenylation domain-containing protein
MDLADLRRSIAELSPDQRALLERRLMRSAPDPAAIPRREATTPCPPSFAQQRLWFLHQLDPLSAVYNISRAVRLRGLLHVEALRQALDAIVARHESLRTTLVSVDGAPVQAIADSRPADLQVVDLTAWPEPDRATELQRRIDEEARRPFDLARDPMLRASLFRLADGEHALSLTMHHIASDGWSLGVLFQELAALYEAFTRGTPSPLPPLPIQYADYAVWQRQSLRGERLNAQLAYWRQRLAGAPAVLELPTDRPRPAVQSLRGARASRLLPRALATALEALSRQEGVTLFMTLLAGFQTLLYRYTGHTDIVVGSPIAGRTCAHVEGLIGLFVNTLALREDLSGEPTFRALLGRVRESAVGAYGHQDVPFEQLVEELQPARSPQHPPLVQVMFVLQNASTPTLGLPGLSSTPLAVDGGTAKFDLTLSVENDAERGLRTTLEYSADLFDAATMDRMLGHWQTLLESVTTHPERSISRVPLLTDAERHQLLVAWNDTAAEYPRAAGLHELFEAQVERTPDAIAVVHGEQSLTYRELNGRANRVAHYLRARGVGPEVLVGLYVERSLLMVEGLLGILKAGGAYVPLDPAYPAARLSFMLRDSGAPILVTQGHLADRLAPQQVEIVRLDLDQPAIGGEPDTNPNVGVTPDTLAYVIYTSGSTGTPKGVMVAHRGLCNLVAAQARVYDVSPDSRILQWASLSFDVSIAEMMLALSTGAMLELPTGNAPVAGADLVRLLRARAITVAALPPSVLATLPVERLPALGTIIVTGEACSADVVARWATGRRFFNAYGPTETTVWATIAACHDDGRRPSIGRPIANTHAYVLDAHGEPVPIGVVGELHVGGVGLARGYLNRPELTAEKFVANPFRAEPGARLYRTGDLVRYLPDGRIDFVGRADHQVKIRGYRVELGEIETVLGSHRAVGDTVVLAREDVPGEPRLVAYVVPGPGQGPMSADLRSFLNERLPHYMVPSAFVILDRLPVTPNGKVDRRALGAPDPTRDAPAETLVAPRDPLERELIAIWETVLGISPVGVRDNFFDLGGHSLLAVRLFARIEAALGKRLPLATLFRAPTVEQLASALREDGSAAPRWSSLVAIQPGGAKPPLFCAHPHLGGVLCYHDLARALGEDQPVYGLQAAGFDGTEIPCTRIDEMAARYLAEVRALQPEGPYFLAGYCFGGVIAFEMAQQLRSQGQAVALLAVVDAAGPAPLTSFHARARRLRQQMTTLARLTPRMRLLALREKMASAATRIGARVTRCLGTERPMDRALRQIEEAHVQAARAYRPQPYPGQIWLFLTAKRFPPSGGPVARWSEVALGGLTVCEVPGDHGEIVEEPRVRILAEHLRAYLDALPPARAA